MKIVAYDPDENVVIISTTKASGFVADLDDKVRYKEKAIASLPIAKSWTSTIPEGLPSIETILRYKLV